MEKYENLPYDPEDETIIKYSNSIKVFYERYKRYPSYRDLCVNSDLPSVSNLYKHFKCTKIYEIFAYIFNHPLPMIQIEMSLDKISRNRSIFYSYSKNISEGTYLPPRLVAKYLNKKSKIGKYTIYVQNVKANRGSSYKFIREE